MQNDKLQDEWSRFFTDHTKAMGTINDEFISIMANFWLSKLSHLKKEMLEQIESLPSKLIHGKGPLDGDLIFDRYVKLKDIKNLLTK